MASFASKPMEYTPFTPEVNAEMYGKLLQKKETDYQQGVQKIDNSLQAVASIPVATEFDRKYLQDKIHGITSELNQNIGTDWSDNAVTKLTSNHISSIANDKNIQKAMLTASNVKKNYDVQSDDTDRTKGANLANNYDYNEAFNIFQQNGKPGDVFDYNYTPYTNTNKELAEFMKQMHPDVFDIVYSGKDKNVPVGYKDYETAINHGKGSPQFKQDVLSSLHSFIENTPNVKAQVAVDAKYTNKDHTGETFKYQKGNELAKQIAPYIDQLEGIDLQLLGKNDQKTIDLLNKKRAQTDEVLTGFKNKYNKQYFDNLANRYDNDKNFRDEENKADYLNSFIAQNYTKFTSGIESTWSTQGLSPMQQRKQQFDMNIAADENKMKHSKEDRDIAKAAKEEADAYQYVPNSAIPTDKAKGSWDKFTTGIKNQESALHEKNSQWLYKAMVESGNIPVDNYFKTDYVNGKEVHLPKTEKADALFKILNTYKQSKRDGKYTVDGYDVTISNMMSEELGSIIDDEENIQTDKAIQTKLENQYKEESGKNKEYKEAVNRGIEQYNTFIANHDSHGIHEKDPQMDPLIAVAKKYGNKRLTEKDFAKVSADSEFKKVFIGEDTKDDNKNFLDDAVAKSNLIYRGGQYVISTKGANDKETEDNFRHTISVIRTHRKGAETDDDEGGSADDLLELAESKSSDGHFVTLTKGWDNDKQKYYYGLASGKKTGKIFVNPNDAIQHLGFERDLAPNLTTLDKRMFANDGTTVIKKPYDKDHPYTPIQDALVLGRAGNDEYRFHVKTSSKGEFFINIYKINTSTGKYEQVPHKDDKGRLQTDIKAGTSKDNLNQLVANLKKQYE